MTEQDFTYGDGLDDLALICRAYETGPVRRSIHEGWHARVTPARVGGLVDEVRRLRRFIFRLWDERRSQLPVSSDNPLDGWWGPWCPDYGRTRHDPDDPAWRALLAQLGMRIDEHGRYWLTRPPPCGHKPWERNLGRDYPTCDGCRKGRDDE